MKVNEQPVVSAALDDLRVLDLSADVAGSYCARLLADYGADVVKVEPPEGSPLRQRHAAGDAPGPYFAWADANKRGVVLDLRTEEGRQALAALAARADVLVEDAPAGVRGDDGLIRSLIAANPHLIVATVTDFGLTGPFHDRPASWLTLNALSGMSEMNRWHDAPNPEPLAHLQVQAGIAACISVLAALRVRDRSGRGQRIDLSVLEVAAGVLMPPLTQHLTGFYSPRSAKEFLRCRDGYVYIHPVQDRAFEAVQIALGLEGIADDPRFAGPMLRATNLAELQRLMAPHLLERDRQELFELLSTLRAVCGMVLAPHELPLDPHLHQRGFFASVKDERGRQLTFPGPPFRSKTLPWRLRRAAPRLGRHTADVCAEWSAWAQVAAPADDSSNQSGGPLHDVRIVDLTQAWAGSYAAMILGDLGADVIKVESMRRPDPWRGGGLAAYQRGTGEPGNRPYNRNALANSVCRNKRGVTLDLAEPEGRRLLRDLIATADVVMDNFTPRVMGNFGVDFAALAALRPGIIALSMPAYGDFGPYSDFPGIGGSIEPMSGNCALLGPADGPPLSSGEMYPDPIAGLNGAAAVLMALHAREHGVGSQYINLSQQESMICMLGPAVVQQALTGTPAAREGGAETDCAPSGQFRCRDGRFVALSIVDDEEWLRLRRRLGDQLPEGLAIGDAAERLAHREALDAAVARWCAERDAGEVEQVLASEGLRVGLVRSLAEVAQCPQLRARSLFTRVSHSELGSYETVGPPWGLTETPASVRMGPPCLGEHSAEVFREVLGLAQREIDALIETGVSGDTPPV